MKTALNKLLKPFSVEVHGSNYVKKLQRASQVKDAFQTQLQVIDNASMIFDVGANKGEITKKYIELYPRAIVHSFEPYFHFQDAFLRLHQTNNNVTLVQKALSNIVSKTGFYVNKSADTNSI